MERDHQPQYFYESPSKTTLKTKTNSSSTLNEESDDDQYIDQSSFHMTDLKEKNKITVTLGEYDPKREYLTVCPGLNLKGMCKQKCVAKNKNTWIRLGYGTFNMSVQLYGSRCPCCKNKIKYSTIKTLGYVQAKVQIKGLKILQNEDTEEFEQTFYEREGKLIYYKDIDDTVCRWGNMFITATKI